MISDAHGRKPPGDSVAVGRVAVEIVRRLVPGEGIDDLAGDPLRRGLAVTLRDMRRRRWCLRMTRTKSNLKPTVGTIRKSMAAMPAA
jgi:hypothetical protein